MAIEVPPGVSTEAISEFLLALADDELILGHRDSEWTGYAPILEEDIAFSNIAQDELGHSLVWFSLYEQLTGKNPDVMAFERMWQDFRCCRFVAYPKGDFAYTVIRQYLFDVAEQVRLRAMLDSSVPNLREVASRIIREEDYHLLHSQGLVERLGDATDESHGKMQSAVDTALPQALGMFEPLQSEKELVKAKVFPGNESLKSAWMDQVVPVLKKSSLSVSASMNADNGGRSGKHTDHLKQLIDDMQAVYRLAPGAKW